MKNLLLLLFVSTIFFSCSETENPDTSNLPQEWILKGYKSVWVPEAGLTPLTDTTYQYRLESDGTFEKKIGSYTLRGTFDFHTYEGEKKYVILNYDEESYSISEEWGGWGLIHYCGQNYESFTLLDSRTVQGSWGNCDGPTLIFERK